MDKDQCEGQLPNKCTFLLSGDTPKISRCKNISEWTVAKKSVSLCTSCKNKMESQVGKDYIIFKPIE